MIVDVNQITKYTDTYMAKGLLTGENVSAHDLSVCPTCGQMINAPVVLNAGPFSYSPLLGFCIDGRRLRARLATHLLLGIIMTRRGVPVSGESLAEAIGTQASNPLNVIAVLLALAKLEVTKAGYDWPFAYRRGSGRFWNGPKIER